MKKTFKLKYILIGICVSILLFIVGIYSYIFISGKKFMDEYKYKAYPSTYISGVDVSNMSDRELSSYMINLEDNIKSIKLNITVNDKNYNYTLDDLGISINKNEVIRDILAKEEKKSLMASVRRLFNGGNDQYQYTITYNEIKIRDFVNNLKKQVDIEGLSGELRMQNNVVSYDGYKEGYALNKEETTEIVENELYKALKNQDIESIDVINVKASGEKIDKSNHDLSSINTKISSYKVKYADISTLKNNLEIAINDIGKVVIMPGKEFSFFEYAGPYDKGGYREFKNMVGNGVCEVSTALYNSVLLTGITDISREHHAELTDYVPGGLDAMVVSLDGQSLTDFKFKNTLNYPIYISAYFEGEYIVIDLWSNEAALDNKEYRVESIALNNLAYDTYLYTYQNGILINSTHLSRDYYKK